MVSDRPTTHNAVEARVDEREGLSNDRPTGPAPAIQVPLERVTSLHGLVVDLDPDLLTTANPFFPPDPDPRRFHRNIRPVLDRHPLARHAEVRSSGTGLHLILRLRPSAELTSAAEQRMWMHIARIVQWSVPSDPRAPGITALTRPVGSINSKNGAVVELLHAGEPVAPGEVIAFAHELAASPFRTIALPLLGSDRVAPCPACLAPDSSLNVLEFKGECYHCGDLRLEDLFARVYLEGRSTGEGEAGLARVARPKTRTPHTADSGTPAPSRPARRRNP